MSFSSEFSPKGQKKKKRFTQEIVRDHFLNRKKKYCNNRETERYTNGFRQKTDFKAIDIRKKYAKY